MVSYKLLGASEEIGIEVIGHASEYGEHSGRNIVCAAISTVCDMVFRGCANYISRFECSFEDGVFTFICPRKPETEAIINAGILELDKIKENYPECFEMEG